MNSSADGTSCERLTFAAVFFGLWESEKGFGKKTRLRTLENA